MPTPLRDVLQLPERVRRGDFVLKLSDGVARPDETVTNYVVTPQLEGCFDQALDLIKSALSGRTSKACYLHGSFGSGKSHFMAVLHLILQGNPLARSIPELAAVIARHNQWAEGKRFLLVPYHMIGQPDMETPILGGYVEQVARLHPTAPTPAVYRADEILVDAQRLRERMSDEVFFAQLNETRGEGDWGAIEQGWNAETFEAALAAPVRATERRDLVSALVDHFFTAAKTAAECIDLDHGLSVISRHAQSLGYDAVILFVDELILWLASHSADVAFLTREGPKLAKLVEAQTADRPIPLVSFVARQRDLKDMIGDNVTGADYLNFSDVLNWWEQRFAKIVLEDRNLPAIAEKRVLRPKSEAARQQIDASFNETARIRDEVMNVLLTSQANRELFRRIYPFSPAFMDMLIEMSFLLQRDRTALKVMLQLLVDQQDRLMLGDIVPVGDIFNYIAEGDEAVSSDIKRSFDNAKRLYEGKFRPLLERENGISIDRLGGMDPNDPKVRNCRSDDRLIKTLLLAALAPNLESFRGMTASRLAALNHGTIRAPIKGDEAVVVLGKCRRWAAEIGQLKIGDEGANPTITVQLSGVDTTGIIESARTFDNKGNRLRTVKSILFQQFGIEEADELFVEHTFVWRGTKRTCEVIFTNVRELPTDSLLSDSQNWRVIVDWPFDDEGHGPADDKAKVDEVLDKRPDGSLTAVWLPSFLCREAQNDLGRLVILEELQKENNFRSYTTQLSETDRNDAKSLLKNQRDQLRQRLIVYLDTAYGISNLAPAAIDPAKELELADHLISLDSAFDLRPPTAANLQHSLQQVLDQALSFQFPAHPVFDDDCKLTASLLKRVLAEIEKAAQTADGRLLVDKLQRREMRQVANPLKLGDMTETHFVLGHTWKDHFLKKEAEHGGLMTAERLREWTDEPDPMGLPRELQNLVVLVFAAQTNRSCFLHGGPVAASIDSLPDEVELRTVELPKPEKWDKAVQRAGHVFGIASSALLNAANVARLAADVTAVAKENQACCTALLPSLETALQQVGLAKSVQRFKTAMAAKSVVETIAKGSDDKDVVERLADWKCDSADAAVGTSLKKASGVEQSLRQVKWDIIDTARKLEGGLGQAAERLVAKLKSALEVDELVTALGPVLAEVERDAMGLIKDAVKGKGAHAGTGGKGSSHRGPAVSCLGSDESDAATFYKNNAAALQRNRQLVAKLKHVYRTSQVHGDSLPAGLPESEVVQVLEVHHIKPLSQGGADSHANMIVVTPTIHSLVHADPTSSVDLKEKKMVLFGVRLELTVKPEQDLR